MVFTVHSSPDTSGRGRGMTKVEVRSESKAIVLTTVTPQVVAATLAQFPVTTTQSAQEGGSDGTDRPHYLCVFYEDSLHDHRGLPNSSQCSVVCTSYNLAEGGESTTMILDKVVPTSIRGGLEGVYIQGSRPQLSKAGATNGAAMQQFGSIPLPPSEGDAVQGKVKGLRTHFNTIEGIYEVPCLDLNWLSNPFAIVPVYVAQRFDFGAAGPTNLSTMPKECLSPNHGAAAYGEEHDEAGLDDFLFEQRQELPPPMRLNKTFLHEWKGPSGCWMALTLDQARSQQEGALVLEVVSTQTSRLTGSLVWHLGHTGKMQWRLADEMVGAGESLQDAAASLSFEIVLLGSSCGMVVRSPRQGCSQMAVLSVPSPDVLDWSLGLGGDEAVVHPASGVLKVNIIDTVVSEEVFGDGSDGGAALPPPLIILEDKDQRRAGCVFAFVEQPDVSASFVRLGGVDCVSNASIPIHDPLTLLTLSTMAAVMEESCFHSLCHRTFIGSRSERRSSVTAWDVLCTLIMESVQHYMTPGNSPVKERKGEGEADDAPPGLEESGHSTMGETDLFDLSHVCFDPALLVLPGNSYTPSPPVSAPPSSVMATTDVVLPSKACCGLVAVGLHLLVESCQIQQVLQHYCTPLSGLLLDLFAMLKMPQYVRHYSTQYCLPDPPLSGVVETFADVVPEDVAQRYFSSTEEVLHGFPSILFATLRAAIKGQVKQARPRCWPTLRRLSRYHPVRVAAELVEMYRRSHQNVTPPGQSATTASPLGGATPPPAMSTDLWWEGIVDTVVSLGYSHFLKDRLAVGAMHPITQACHLARDKPHSAWHKAHFEFIGRHDRAQLAPAGSTGGGPSSSGSSGATVLTSSDILRGACERSHTKIIPSLSESELVLPEECFRRWPDTRLDSIVAILNTSVPITLSSRGDGSDVVHQNLLQLARRALALSVGRGALTYATQNFRVRDLIPIPPLNVNGISSDGLNIALDASLLTPELLLWPTFHNGCAAGFRYLPFPSEGQGLITRHWVVYQSRDSSTEQQVARAGLLLAVGVMGHFSSLQTTDIFSLLITPTLQGIARDPTTIALMLGLGCSFRGTSNDTVYRCLSLHVASLTQAAEDLEVTIEVQQAALISIGLLCEGCCHTILCSVMLSEISRVPTDEHCQNRDGYSLAAGIGLGLLMLGRGRHHGMGTAIEDRLLTLMTGGMREKNHEKFGAATADDMNSFLSEPGTTSSFLSKAIQAHEIRDQENPCTKVWEGDYYNHDVTSGAATFAIGLAFLQTNDESMATKLAPPATLTQLEAVPNNIAMYRSLFSGLIMWDSLTPTTASLNRYIPRCLVDLVHRCKEHPELLDLAQNAFLMTNLGFCVAGSTLAVGIRYAGSLDKDAKEVVMRELKAFAGNSIGTLGVKINVLQAKSGTFVPCICACATALALIMAGTGDAACFAILRRLHRRTTMNYGAHMAIGQAMGILFLSGGGSTIDNSLPNAASLIISCFPTWPSACGDNAFYLQPLRHLYARCIVPRLLQTVDIMTKAPVSVNVRLVTRSGRIGVEDRSESVGKSWTPMPTGTDPSHAVALSTPCLLPTPDSVDRLEVRSVDYFPVTLINDGRIGAGRLRIDVLRKANASTAALEEQRVLSHLSGLLAERGTHCVTHSPAALSAKVRCVDNLLLVLAVVDKFFSGASASSAFRYQSSNSAVSAIPVDVVAGVRRSMERTYQKLFSMFAPDAPPSSMTCSPLRRILLEKESISAVLRSTDKDSSADGPSDDALDQSLLQWVTLALHYHGLADTNVTAMLLPLSIKAHDGLRVASQRPYLVPKIASTTGISPFVVESVVDLCVATDEKKEAK